MIDWNALQPSKMPTGDKRDNNSSRSGITKSTIGFHTDFGLRLKPCHPAIKWYAGLVKAEKY